MVTTPEMMRQVHLESYGETEDPRVSEAVELFNRWSSVHSMTDEGGDVYVERSGVTDLAEGRVMIAWRPLNTEMSAEDWEIVKYCVNDATRDFLPEPYDWLMASLSGDRLVIIPHSMRLLEPFNMPRNVS